jgi:hypothetical protein
MAHIAPPSQVTQINNRPQKLQDQYNTPKFTNHQKAKKKRKRKQTQQTKKEKKKKKIIPK